MNKDPKTVGSNLARTDKGKASWRRKELIILERRKQWVEGGFGEKDRR